jgi:hypothetical protein
MEILASMDVVVFSEVAATRDQHHRQNEVFCQLLSDFSGNGTQFTCVSSAPSRVYSNGEATGQPEVHVVFARDPVKIKSHRTWEGSADGDELVTFDHAPLTVLLEDPRFDESCREIVLTSVHLPPGSSKRVNARDRQLNAMLSGYPTESGTRLGQAFTQKGHKDAKRKGRHPIHLVTGDFNIYPGGPKFDVAKHGWAEPLLGAKIATSAGCKQLDNLLVDKESHERFVFSHEVLRFTNFKNARTSTDGVSDHAPIFLKVTQAITTD